MHNFPYNFAFLELLDNVEWWCDEVLTSAPPSLSFLRLRPFSSSPFCFPAVVQISSVASQVRFYGFWVFVGAWLGFVGCSDGGFGCRWFLRCFGPCCAAGGGSSEPDLEFSILCCEVWVVGRSGVLSSVSRRFRKEEVTR
ncbi:hypothetical protein P8452_58214 [Trifolium repens]|nr:hypothetical protein P8452_58214 [Trifolium repens]